MSQDRLHIRIAPETKTKLETIAERNDSSMTQASRTVLEHGLDYLGYNGGRSRFQQLTDNVATGLFHAGATIMLLSFFGSISMLIIGISIMGGSLGVIGLGRLLSKRYDPQLTQKLPEVHIE
jgi:uncharacterized membrane protein YhfC